MKKIIFRFKLLVKFSVSLITSREFAFIFVFAGVIGQISHCYFLIESISSLVGWYKSVQASLVAFFISASLLYFVSIAPEQDEDGIENNNVQRILNAVTIFTIIEIIINLYYYSRHLILDSKGNYVPDRILDFIFSIMISILIPWTIKLYASQIKAKDSYWTAEFEEKPEPEPKSELTEDVLNEKFNEKMLEIDEKMSSIDEKIGESFDNKQQLFLNQFENRLKTIANKTKTE